MKRINKTEYPKFNNFIKQNKPNNWSDCIEIKPDLRKHILETEQNGVCAYCEMAITSDNSSSHIDHFKRKAGHLFPELEFDYNNLLVSCFSKKNSNLHCAEAKDVKLNNRHDWDNLINPVKDEPSEHLKYAFTGDVLAMDDKGKFTIDTFNLNQENLINRRKTLVYQLVSLKSQVSLETVKSSFKENESLIEYIWNS